MGIDRGLARADSVSARHLPGKFYTQNKRNGFHHEAGALCHTFLLDAPLILRFAGVGREQVNELK